MIIRYTNAFLLFDDDQLPEVGGTAAAIGGIAVGGKVRNLVNVEMLLAEQRIRRKEESLLYQRKQFQKHQKERELLALLHHGEQRRKGAAIWATVLAEL